MTISFPAQCNWILGEAEARAEALFTEEENSRLRYLGMNYFGLNMSEGYREESRFEYDSEERDSISQVARTGDLELNTDALLFYNAS